MPVHLEGLIEVDAHDAQPLILYRTKKGMRVGPHVINVQHNLCERALQSFAYTKEQGINDSGELLH